MNEPLSPAGPPPRIRRIGRALNDTVARAPWLWPVIRRPMRNFFDRLAGEWDQRTADDSVQRLAALAAGLLHVSPGPERALDLGTGTGEGALLVAREFPRASVRGVDFSEEMIAIARAKVGLDPEGRIAFKVADAANLPWPDGSFDLVVQLNVPVFFAEVARVLRAPGHVVIASSHGDQTPFYTSPTVIERGFAKRGISKHAVGAAGSGTYWVGRKGA
jgi:SAM-dependent methyltransferase